MRKHIPHFEVLRGIAALWVFASHVLLITGTRIKFLSNGDQAVEVFVMLSGFVITLMLSNEGEPYDRYIFRRFMRLYPLFLVALVFGLLTNHLYQPVFGESPWLHQVRTVFQTRDENLANAFFQHLGLHLTMLHGMVPDSILPQASLMFSGPLWSISLEWQFYLIAPLLIGAIGFGNTRRIAISAGILLFAIGLEQLTMNLWMGEVPSFLPLRLPLFIVGIMCAALWRDARDARPAVLVVSVVVGFAIASFFAPNKLPIAMWFAIYFLAAAHDKFDLGRLADKLISSPVPTFVGRVSYGLYVLHVPTMMLVTYYIVFPMDIQSRFYAAVAITTLTLPITLALAALSFHTIEKPLARWARGFGRGRAPAE
ncbi:acyltransferase [Rhizobium lentis]|uniref:Peptidoglycan/LPS O-acetylase OafA/YrhL n=1 Tax=Rhizobium lentis TaxID=1138194 RepID=A0A7W8XF53_9HYPH|nr:acyltransferase [Rhizobium lentis]MBB4574372.1 peptidoglycan/LPS O-acetylase OafA/YrhL [Rhizobium lentis]MBB5550298.1 peptidoglycan/LPS O-acetylase OafA/YrhL [Rhizobium lentis]MBB5560673.1 peptidoglycan/LPS O-acetylase OafA/YrhL [Rhizobium lentis]MBB5567258.1 peptidoglycan/LPS O-acetylase OafA/YrhL [Rhizobium lentis]